MGDLFPCTIPERKVKIKTTEVERIALGVVRMDSRIDGGKTFAFFNVHKVD